MCLLRKTLKETLSLWLSQHILSAFWPHLFIYSGTRAVLCATKMKCNNNLYLMRIVILLVILEMCALNLNFWSTNKQGKIELIKWQNRIRLCTFCFCFIIGIFITKQMYKRERNISVDRQNEGYCGVGRYFGCRGSWSKKLWWVDIIFTSNRISLHLLILLKTLHHDHSK